MLMAGEILSCGPEKAQNGLYYRCGGVNGDALGVVDVVGMLGRDVDGLDLEEAIEAAAVEGKIIVLRINSPGGRLDDAMDLWRVIEKAELAGRKVDAFVERAYGAAWFLARRCGRVMLNPGGSVGYFGLTCDCLSQASVERRQEEVWKQICARRPHMICSESIERFAGQAAFALDAEKLGFVSVVCTWEMFLSTVCNQSAPLEVCGR